MMDQAIGGCFNFSANRPHVLPVGAFGVNPQRWLDTYATRTVFQAPIDPVASTSNILGLNGSWQRFHDTFTSSFSKPNIRQQGKYKLKELIRPGRVIQVCGGPLVGKSTFVKEVLGEFRCQPEGNNIIQYHIMCKGFSSYLSVLTGLYQKLHIKESPNEFMNVDQIMIALGKWPTKHHVFMFHKCEALKDSHELYKFLDFLGDLSQMGIVTVIFTSYKLFPQQSNMCNLQVGMLDDAKDIQSLLSFYTNGNHSTQIPGYVSLILRCNLCFPLAIRYLAQVYLQGSNAPSPEEVEDSIKGNSLNFLEGCLGGHLAEVENWLLIDKLKWIVLLCPQVDVSCSADQLWSMTEETGWSEIQAHLRENFALCMEPGLKRLRFHPLLLLYFMKALESRRLVLKGEWFDQSCNKIVKFLCRVLDQTEIVSRCRGNKFALFTCLLPEWCHMKNAMQMAVYRNDYKVYWKVATSGAGLLIKWSSEEALDFYRAMYESSSQNGFRTRKETAVLEGCLAYALAQGRGTPNHGNYFQQSQVMLMRSLNRERDETFCVSDWQREELAMTINIFKLIPMIFQGDNMKALTELHRIMGVMEDNNHYHFEYSTVLNLMGLAVQRGNGNLDRSIFYYKQSLEERMHLINVCPQDLVVPYNNLAMLQYKRKQTDKALQNLFKALAIRRRYGWKNYYTALTLTHLGDIHVKLESLVNALNYYRQADDILRETSKNHDLRLRLNLALGHAVVAIDTMGMSSTTAATAATAACSYPSPHPPRVLPLEPNVNSSGNGNGRGGVGEWPSSSHTCSSDCIANLDHTLLSRKSAKYYFWQVDLLAKQSKGTLSDHGHGQLIGSLEHLILLEWNNPAMMTRYVQRIGDIMSTFPWMIHELQKPEAERNAYINGHNKFYKYISDTDPRDLDVKILIHFLYVNCDCCKYRGKGFVESTWEEIISFYCKKREKCASQLRSGTVCTESRDSYASTCQLSLHSTERLMERNSPDLYMRLGFSSSSDPDVENGNIESCCDDMHLTKTKHVEPNLVISPSNEECRRVSCESNEDNLLCGDAERAPDSHHRSMEEASWNELHSYPFVSEVNRKRQVDSDELFQNIPNLSVMYSAAQESQTPFINSNNNIERLHNSTSINLQQFILQTYEKDKRKANGNVCVETGKMSLYNNGTLSKGKSGLSKATTVDPAFSQVEAHPQERAHNRSKKIPCPESGFVSDGDSIVNGNRMSEHLNLTRLSSDGRCLALTHETGDFGDTPADNVFGVHESNVGDGLLPLVFPVEDCRGVPAITVPLTDWLRESDFLNDNFRVNNGNPEAPVDPCFVGNNDMANFNANAGNDVTQKLSKLTLSDSTQVNRSQGSTQLDPIPSAKQCKRLPSEQDERDVN